MTKIHQVKTFVFPYGAHRFAGQGIDERILYITREHKLYLFLRIFFILLISAAILMAFYVFSLAFENIFSSSALALLLPLTLILISAFNVIGFWWIYCLWQRSLAILTNKRLTKIVYTTPFNRYNQSLPLEMIVDTSCNNQGFFEGVASSILKIGNLTARSSASSSGVATNDTDRINRKYFYLEHIKYCEDFQQYLNKVLNMFNNTPEQLLTFRPFIPHLKYEDRNKFLQDYYNKEKNLENQSNLQQPHNLDNET
jgi:hypothetical protein